jgi:hypothetical protein
VADDAVLGVVRKKIGREWGDGGAGGRGEVDSRGRGAADGVGVTDYACPFGSGFRGELNARFLRLPRPVVKDYACPFGVLAFGRFLDGPFPAHYACPFALSKRLCLSFSVTHTD